MKKKNRGFTLLEVMVAAAVLSLGTVLIFQSFFTVVRAYDYCSSYIATSAFAHQKLWEAAESVRQEDALPVPASGEFVRGGKTFAWNLSRESAGDMVSRVTVRVHWSSGKREIDADRSAYVTYEKK